MSAGRRALARVVAAVALGGAAAAGSATGCGAQDGVVGGGCADGYTQCDLSCLDLSSDPQNCGSCGHACPAGVACTAGACGGVGVDASLDGSDGAPVDANDVLDGLVCDVRDPAHPYCSYQGDGAGTDHGPDADANGSGDATDGGDGASDGSLPGDGSSSDDGSGSGDGSASGDGSFGDASADACTPPFDTPQSCGSCGNVCVAPNDLCSLEDGGFQCVATCPPPLVDCAGHCVNTQRDPNNCGTCGKKCASQYCAQATCQGSVAGNIMVLGHDFQKAQATDQETKLLVNSVFYNAGAVTLLSFEHYADAPTVKSAVAILQAYAASTSVTLNVQSTKDDTSLANDTLLTAATTAIVWDQPNAPAGVLGGLGSAWAPHLLKFVQGGGVVIALDADQGVGQMPALITSAGLLSVTGHAPVAAGSPVDVPVPGLGIARGMTSVYAVDANTAWFSTSEPATPTTLYVANVQGQTAQLVAVHKIVN